MEKLSHRTLESAQVDALESLMRIARRMELYFEAADSWLRDPDDPTRYSLSPRETEVTVIWERIIEDGDKTKTVRRKERIADLLKRLGEKGGPAVDEIRVVEVDAGNPRKLFLDGVQAGRPLYELIGKATGQIRQDPAATVNVLVASPEWVELQAAIVAALRPYPEARRAVLDAIGERPAIEAGVGR